MARRSWKKSGVQKFVDGGMPQYGGQYVGESPEIEAKKRGLMQAQMGMPPQGMPQQPMGRQPLTPEMMQQLQQAKAGMGQPSQAAYPQIGGMPQQPMGRQPLTPEMMQQLQQAKAGMGQPSQATYPQIGGMPQQPMGRQPLTPEMMQKLQQAKAGMGQPSQATYPQRMQAQMGMPPSMGQQAGMGQPSQATPAQSQPQMPNMDKYMQMVQARQQDMARRGMSPQELPSADMLRQMPTDQVRQVLGQTVLGPQGMQQLQQQAAKAGGIRPTEMQYLRNPAQAAQQAMGMQQRPAPQASMGQQNMSRAMSGAAMPRVSGFAEGGSIDSRMAELDRYLSDPNLKMVRTKSGKFQFVPINAPKRAAPKPAAKPAAKAAAKPAMNRAAANAVPGARGKPKTGGGSIPTINRPLSAFTGSNVKPVKPTGMTKSTPLPRGMTGVNQTPIRGRDIAGAVAKGAATGLAMGMGPGALGAGKAMLGKGISRSRPPVNTVPRSTPLKTAAPKTAAPKTAAPKTAAPKSATPNSPSSRITLREPKDFTFEPVPARMGSKTARIPKPKATEYKAPAMKAGAAKRAAEALKRREVTAEEAMDMMKGYKHGGPPKKAPRGMHYMPNGKLMKNSAHKKGRK